MTVTREHKVLIFQDVDDVSDRRVFVTCERFLMHVEAKAFKKGINTLGNNEAYLMPDDEQEMRAIESPDEVEVALSAGST